MQRYTPLRSCFRFQSIQSCGLLGRFLVVAYLQETQISISFLLVQVGLTAIVVK